MDDRAPETTRKIVAQFHKLPSGILELRSVTAIIIGNGWEDARGYDVDLSRRHGYIYHISGAGCAWPVVVDGIYYASRGVEIKEERNRLVSRVARARNRTRRLARMPTKFKCDGGDVLNWLERNGIDDDSVWCAECKDWVVGEWLCDHCWWCDEIGWYSTPSDRCPCANCEGAP